MRVRVRFRFNAASGEVELFQIDDVGAEGADGVRSRGPAHDREHDEISAEIGAVAARRPGIEEVRPVMAGFHIDPEQWSQLRRVRGEDQESDPATETGERETE